MTRVDKQNSRMSRDRKEQRSGKCNINECTVIHFPLGKKNQYGSYLEKAINNLTLYAKNYYYNWEETAWDKFMSWTDLREPDEKMAEIFWLWYITNYRFFQDVSPIIDFYFVEYEDKFDEIMKMVVNALRRSYLSVYKVEWINNNAVGLKDIFISSRDFVVERNFGDVTRIIEEGDLLLLRLVIVNNAVIAVGRTVVISSDNEEFLVKELNSCRINERISDMEVFLREHAEFLCGLVMDLSIGIRKNTLKSCSLIWKDSGQRDKFIRMVKKSDFVVLEQGSKCLKLACKNESPGFKRVYLGMSSLVVVADNDEDLDFIISRVDSILNDDSTNPHIKWSEGYDFTCEEEAEEILLEVMHDKYLEEWLNTPKHELDGMTPVEAVKNLKGRVLMENLLSDLEIMEIKARNRGEYYLPAYVIRKRLNLHQNINSREMLNPEVMAIRVEKFRLRQKLSPYVGAYTWINESYRQIAAAFYNIYYRVPEERPKLAWIIFMWNEFSTLFRPKIYKPEWWMAALEYAYQELAGMKIAFAKIAKKFGIATGLISKNAQLIVRHFNQYPLDFSRPLAWYPRFEELDDEEKIKIYEEVWHHLCIFADCLKNIGENRKKKCKNYFYQFVDENRKFWNESIKEVYNKFCFKSALLDFKGEDEKTIAHIFWDEHASMFPPYLKTAAFNLIMSYVGVYEVNYRDANGIRFKDFFTGQSYEIYGILGWKIKEKIKPGMLCITRLLPLTEGFWVLPPLFVIMPEITDIFSAKVQMLLENCHPYDANDFDYLKIRGQIILKSYVLALDEMEQNTLNLINQPLEIKWQVAELIAPDKAVMQLKKYGRFKLLTESEEVASFIWIVFSGDQNYQWGYVLILHNKLFLTVPPGKDQGKMLKDIRKAFRSEDIVVFFRDYTGSFQSLKRLESYMVAHLAAFFNKNPEMSLALLRQDDLGDEKMEMTQGIFLLKLGSRLMEHLKEN
ncbi:hypothetical protein [Thermosyntropha sp.]|uniref:hypothetical protein n=1 Tax=Thermosyntropha sp. TaxID=2740820 RepID=UPI0025EF3DE0|nr:hypothetical protein [Thermosyntropha sp.]MBO8158803.1 hypothetical protein [Thermosyntropha sp.]